MPTCSAYKCKARRSKKIPGVSFHKFPKEEKRRQAWVYATRRVNWQPTDYSYLCSDHFRENDFEPDSPFKKLLKKDVIPSVFPQLPAYLQPKIPRERRTIVKHPLVKNKKEGERESSENLEPRVTTAGVSLNRKETEITFIDLSLSPVSKTVEGNQTDNSQPASVSENAMKPKEPTKIVFNQTERVCPKVVERVKELKIIKKKIDAHIKRVSTKNQRMRASIQKLKISLAELKDDTAKDNAVLLSLFENSLVEPETETETENNCIEEIIEDVPIVEQTSKDISKDKYTDFGMFLANELKQIPIDDLNVLKNEIRLLVNKNRWA